jgi:predicted nucleic-acid-binding protein
VILRYLIGDDASKARQAARLMERLEQGQERVEVIETVVAESVWTLETFYRVPKSEISNKLSTLLGFRGIRCRDKRTILQAFNLYASIGSDFVDCLLAAKSLRKKLNVYSFDERDFKKLKVAWERPG